MRPLIRRLGTAGLWLLFVTTVGLPGAQAQEAPSGPETTRAGATQPAPEPKPTFEFYGYAMMDIGQDFKQIDPDWFDTMRVSRLPKVENEYGRDNNTFASVRQTRFGIRSSVPTALGDAKANFEFNLFGSGANSGETTFRLRHAYGELGQVLAGQTWSVFMDSSTFPNSLEYFGPTGIVYFRNIQVRWTPVTGTHTLMVSVERPGASGDDGVYADRIEFQNITPRFPVPDFATAYKYTKGWGHVRVAGLVREIKWDDNYPDEFDFSGSATGWGLNVTSNLKPTGNDLVRLAFVTGEGIQNYMNDSPVDVGISANRADRATPLVGKAIPIVGMSAFVDHTWNEKFASTVGYSWQENDNTDGQLPDAFHVGHYALGNLLYYPATGVMIGGELQWGRRENFSDGFHSDGIKVQFSFKYNFGWKLGG